LRGFTPHSTSSLKKEKKQKNFIKNAIFDGVFGKLDGSIGAFERLVSMI
jgi:hypothetical protein